MRTEEDLSVLEGSLGYRFSDKSLLKQALTHSSYANEHRKEKLSDNERLEFLGDAILEMVSSDLLYHSRPDMKEGQLSKLRASLVCEQALALCAHEMNLMPFLYLGRGEDMTGGRFRDSIVSDAVESVIAAIFLDSGIEEADHFIRTHILNDIEKRSLFVDSKSILQEYVQAEGKTCRYELVEEKGPDHDKWFTVACLINDKEICRGEGHTKKRAEQQAAYLTLQKIRG